MRTSLTRFACLALIAGVGVVAAAAPEEASAHTGVAAAKCERTNLSLTRFNSRFANVVNYRVIADGVEFLRGSTPPFGASLEHTITYPTALIGSRWVEVWLDWNSPDHRVAPFKAFNTRIVCPTPNSGTPDVPAPPVIPAAPPVSVISTPAPPAVTTPGTPDAVQPPTATQRTPKTPKVTRTVVRRANICVTGWSKRPPRSVVSPRVPKLGQIRVARDINGTWRGFRDRHVVTRKDGKIVSVKFVPGKPCGISPESATSTG